MYSEGSYFSGGVKRIKRSGEIDDDGTYGLSTGDFNPHTLEVLRRAGVMGRIESDPVINSTETKKSYSRDEVITAAAMSAEKDAERLGWAEAETIPVTDVAFASGDAWETYAGDTDFPADEFKEHYLEGVLSEVTPEAGRGLLVGLTALNDMDKYGAEKLSRDPEFAALLAREAHQVGFAGTEDLSETDFTAEYFYQLGELLSEKASEQETTKPEAVPRADAFAQNLGEVSVETVLAPSLQTANA